MTWMRMEQRHGTFPGLDKIRYCATYGLSLHSFSPNHQAAGVAALVTQTSIDIIN